MAGGKGTIFVGKSAFKSATPQLFLYCIIYAFGSVFFGYDSASFGGVQAMTPYVRQFGEVDPKTKKYALSSAMTGLLNSLPLLGKFLGSLVVGPITERFGHKKTMGITCLVQLVGAIIQCTSHVVPQFIVGRFFVYTAVGLVENVVPTYQTELAPAPLRGFFVGSIQLCLTFGSLIAGIVNESMAKRTDASGWQIATSIQAVPPVLILCGLWFTPDSPRWLVSRDRADDALVALKRVRRKEEVERGVCELEIAAMLEDSRATRRKGPWSDLVRGTNRRRLNIACGIMALQQLTGVTFSSSYGPTFYKSQGLGQMSFAYAAISNGVSVVTALIAMIILDMFGRRDVTFHGCWSQALFLGLLAGLGGKAHPSTSDVRGMVASFIIYAAILHATLGPAAYITAAEVGTGALREKTMSVSTAVNVVVSFVVVFITPYLLDDLGPRLGYVWMGCSILGCVWVWLCMPELKGRTLEEVDQLFEAKLPAWRFKGYETSGLAHDVAAMQAGNDGSEEMMRKKLGEGDVELHEVREPEAGTIRD